MLTFPAFVFSVTHHFDPKRSFFVFIFISFQFFRVSWLIAKSWFMQNSGARKQGLLKLKHLREDKAITTFGGCIVCHVLLQVSWRCMHVAGKNSPTNFFHKIMEVTTQNQVFVLVLKLLDWNMLSIVLLTFLNLFIRQLWANKSEFIDETKEMRNYFNLKADFTCYWCDF